jgi:hypothetical protein
MSFASLNPTKMRLVCGTNDPPVPSGPFDPGQLFDSAEPTCRPFSSLRGLHAIALSEIRGAQQLRGHRCSGATKRRGKEVRATHV